MKDYRERGPKIMQNKLRFTAVVEARSGADESLPVGRQGLRNEDAHGAKAGICKHLYIKTLKGSSLLQLLP